MPRDLKRLYKLISNAPNSEDFVLLLRGVLDRVADIRTGFGNKLKTGGDSLEVRQAAAFILTDMIDTIRITRQAEVQRKGGAPIPSDAESESLDTDETDDLL